ncbi:MAG: hypothetical protein V3U12_04325 [Nitrosopumilaceae archaeon]
MTKWTAMWTGSIGAFVVFVIVTQILLGGDREFPASGDEGFKMLYPKDLPLTGIHFFIDTAKNPTNILFIAVADVENRQDYALIALEIPYRGTLKDESGWQWKPFEDSTLVVKEFSCSPDVPCSFVDDIQYFEFELDEQIDQKQSFRHSVRLWFSEVNPLLDLDISPLVRKFNPDRKTYNVGFNEVDSAMATVILDKSSDSFGPTPNAPIVPGPRPNTIQLDWQIEGGILHQIDYQLPKERTLETQMLYYTALFGIGLGITNLAIFGAEQRKRKFKDDHEKNSGITESGDTK